MMTVLLEESIQLSIHIFGIPKQKNNYFLLAYYIFILPFHFLQDSDHIEICVVVKSFKF